MRLPSPSSSIIFPFLSPVVKVSLEIVRLSDGLEVESKRSVSGLNGGGCEEGRACLSSPAPRCGRLGSRVGGEQCNRTIAR